MSHAWKPEPARFCELCGTQLKLRRWADCHDLTTRPERLSAFRRRRFCDLTCRAAAMSKAKQGGAS